MFWKREAFDVLWCLPHFPGAKFPFLPSGNGFLILVTPPPSPTPGRINGASPNPVSSLRGRVFRGSLLGPWAQHTVQQELLHRKGLWNEFLMK